MAAPPSYVEHVTRRWALEACADDPAMQAAFRAAGARDGWVAGLSVRAYCEREGLMQTATSQRGVPKQALAAGVIGGVLAAGVALLGAFRRR